MLIEKGNPLPGLSFLMILELFNGCYEFLVAENNRFFYSKCVGANIFLNLMSSYLKRYLKMISENDIWKTYQKHISGKHCKFIPKNTPQ